MNDIEWVQRELARYETEEQEALQRLTQAYAISIRAEAELAAAREFLAGVQGGKKEFRWQLDYLKKHGELP